MPSPTRQREELERLVAQRTAEKEKAILDMHHAVGNILAIAAAAIRLQDQPGTDRGSLRNQALARIQEIAEEHQSIAAPHRPILDIGVSGELRMA